MSTIADKYDAYLKEHISNVQVGYDWLLANAPQLFTDDINKDMLRVNIKNHDKSKYFAPEYDSYAEWFYGEQTQESKKEFDLGWLHHQHENPHHWQHWILVNDDEGTYCLDMPKEYLIEMFCDWWAFSWKKNDLFEVFSWYQNHKDNIQLSNISRNQIEDIMHIVYDVLQERVKNIYDKG